MQTTADHVSVTTTSSPHRQLFQLVRGHLLERLRVAFDQAEEQLLQQGEDVSLCADLRRQRRTFIDNYLGQLQACCDDPGQDWIVGTLASISKARTMLYLTGADEAVRDVFQQQPDDAGKLAALWNRQTGMACTVLSCPLSLHTQTRLFYRLLPELSLPLRIRYVIARAFCALLPGLHRIMLATLCAALQRMGDPLDSMEPLPLPEWWEPLERIRRPPATVQAMLVPEEDAGEIAALACALAEAALTDEPERVQALLRQARQTSLQPWLLCQTTAATSALPATGQQLLQWLAGPLLLAACEETFVDAAHPARRVMDILGLWLPGWYDCLGEQGAVVDACMILAADVARVVASRAGQVMPAWMDMLDYLSQQQQTQKDTTVVVASARLSLQVAEVRAEVDALLAERAGLECWPAVVIEILRDQWSALLSAINWREGPASDAWLNAIGIADELMASVQPVPDRLQRQRQMQRVPPMLQALRRGFDEIGCERQHYSALLERLERIHLGMLQADTAGLRTEPVERWPPVMQSPEPGEPFAVGSWWRRADGSLVPVQFSDQWCTVLLDTRHGALECHATAQLCADYRAGNFVLQCAVAALLPLA